MNKNIISLGPQSKVWWNTLRIFVFLPVCPFIQSFSSEAHRGIFRFFAWSYIAISYRHKVKVTKPDFLNKSFHGVFRLKRPLKWGFSSFMKNRSLDFFWFFWRKFSNTLYWPKSFVLEKSCFKVSGTNRVIWAQMRFIKFHEKLTLRISWFFA